MRALCTCDFDVPSAMPEDLGDLAVLQAFDVVQHEGGAAAGRQLRDRAIQVHLAHRALGQVAAARIRNPRLLVVQRVGDLAGAGGAAAQVIEAQVRRQAIQPGAERRLAAERIELAMRDQEDVLEEIFRLRECARPSGRSG